MLSQKHPKVKSTRSPIIAGSFLALFAWLSPAHAIAQVRLGRLHREVKMISHDDVSMQSPPKPRARLEQARLERLRCTFARK